MKIILLVSSLGAGGAERVATTLCNAWSSRGEEVTLVATFSGNIRPFYPLHEGVSLVQLAEHVEAQPGRKQYLRRLFALRQIITNANPDVVISFLPNVNVAAVLATSFTRIPCIVCERSDPSMFRMGRLLSAACALLYRFSDAVVVQTEAVASHISRIYGGLRRVSVVPNPLPQELTEMVASPRTSGQRALLSLGRLANEKRVDMIIAAFSALSSKYADWDLRVYGDGDARAALEAQVNQLGLQGRVTFYGTTNQPWLAMKSADAFVLASAFEGFPNALLEAMGIGLACVAVDCPSGPREMTQSGRDALLVPPGDTEALICALDRLMADAGLRRALGDRARSSIRERYGLDNVLHMWDQVFCYVGARS